MFASRVVGITCAAGTLELGIVDASRPGVAEGVSRLLCRSIADARESRGGHLPEWLVDDIVSNYICPEKVATLWAPTGHRFCAVKAGEIVGTIHVARDPDTIFTVDRWRLNVHARDFPGFKPEGFHHTVNISVKHELRRAKIATAMVDAIATSFRSLFAGDGLWFRADPPWHPGLAGLGFVHDPSRDIFLPEDVVRTAGLPHAELNARYACDCAGAPPERAASMRVKKLQYVSMTRAFDLGDHGRVAHARPARIERPGDAEETASVLARANGSRVIVRGRAQSAAGQSLAAGAIVVATEHMRRIDVGDDRVTIGAGVTGEELVRALAPRGMLPAVVSSWPAATIAGTLAAGGIGKGSHRGGMLVDHVASLVVVTGDGRVVRAGRGELVVEAALGGLGSFGVIVEATLSLVPHPPAVQIEKTSFADAGSLRAALLAAGTDLSTYHVTAWRDGTDLFAMARRVRPCGGTIVPRRRRARGLPPSVDPAAARVTVGLAPRPRSRSRSRAPPRSVRARFARR